MKKILLSIINYYQSNISPTRPRTCNFIPTCSHYAKEAITIHGAGYGSFLAVKRILKCYPFRKITFDPVPEKKGVKK